MFLFLFLFGFVFSAVAVDFIGVAGLEFCSIFCSITAFLSVAVRDRSDVFCLVFHVLFGKLLKVPAQLRTGILDVPCILVDIFVECEAEVRVAGYNLYCVRIYSAGCNHGQVRMPENMRCSAVQVDLIANSLPHPVEFALGIWLVSPENKAGSTLFKIWL